MLSSYPHHMLHLNFFFWSYLIECHWLITMIKYYLSCLCKSWIIFSILLPYSIDSSYSKNNSGTIRNLILEPSSDLMNPFALSKALNVSLTSFLLPSTVKKTLACDKSFVNSTSVIVINPTLGCFYFIINDIHNFFFICSPTRSALILLMDMSPLYYLTYD